MKRARRGTAGAVGMGLVREGLGRWCKGRIIVAALKGIGFGVYQA